MIMKHQSTAHEIRDRGPLTNPLPIMIVSASMAIHTTDQGDRYELYRYPNTDDWYVTLVGTGWTDNVLASPLATFTEAYAWLSAYLGYVSLGGVTWSCIAAASTAGAPSGAGTQTHASGTATTPRS